MRGVVVCGRLVTAGFLLCLGGCVTDGQNTSPGSAASVSAATPAPPPITREAPNGRRVSVATYNVGFSRETVRGAQSRGLMARGTASTQVKTKLEGVPDQVFQRIADAGLLRAGGDGLSGLSSTPH